MITIKNKRILFWLSTSVIIASLFTGCSPFNIPPIIDEVRLTSIEVSPLSMALEIDESRTIDLVTAHYNNGTVAHIALSACTYESDKPSIATVTNGTIKGILSCTASTAAIITVSYTENDITTTDTISVVVTNPTPT